MNCHFGDCREVMRRLTVEGVKVQMCVTSPPYWGLRDYGHAGQLGLEPTPQKYVANMVEVFGLVREMLADDGVLWLNLGDSYAGGGRGGGSEDCKQRSNVGSLVAPSPLGPGLKPKDLVGIPWRVAFALQADGWYLRSEITWCKRAPMPESVTDRPTSATEKIFLLSKSPDYYYNADAVRNPPSEAMLSEVSEGYNGHSTKLFDDTGAQDASSVKSRIIEGARNRVEKQRGHSRRS